MYRCPTCVSVVQDLTVRRCPVCGENFRRRPPAVLGATQRGKDKLTTWDMKASADASRLYAQESEPATKPAIDLTKEHLRDKSGRTAAVDRR
jgi:predicted  nucleic acid-binding Zn-ribbon protein